MLRKTINPKVLATKYFVSLVLLAFVLLTGCQQTPSPEVSPEPLPQPNNDLIFAPAEIAVAPGSESSVSVQVSTGADLKTAIFELAQALNGVSVSFVSDADGKTGDLIIAAGESLAEGTQTLNVMGKSGSNTWLGKLTVTASVVAPKTYRVSAFAGKDTNPGTTAAPFKTLFKALLVAKAGDTIRLRSGVYSQASNGEKFTVNSAPVIVPAGVTIIGELDGDLNLSILQGNFGLQDTALVLDGDATVKNLHVQGFGVALLARGGKQTLSHLLLEENRIGLLGVSTPTTSPVTSLTGSTILLRNIANAKGVLLGTGAKLTMTNGRIDGGNPNCTPDGFGLELSGQTQVTLNGVTLENIPGITLSLTDTSKATLNTTIIKREMPLRNCSPRPTIQGLVSATLNLNETQLIMNETEDKNPQPEQGGGDSIGIDWQSKEPLNVTNSRIEGHSEAGIRAFFGQGTVTVTSSTFTFNRKGIFSSTPKVIVLGSTFTNNTDGIHSNNLKLRNSILTGGSTGILGSGNIDLGTSSDAGNNIIVSNLTNMQYNGAGLIFAAGNRWNTNTQGSDNAGRYTARLVNGLAIGSGTNFQLFNNIDSRIQF